MLGGAPLFSVATVTYNSGAWIRQTIESILSSSFTDFELLIYDDCSSDDTWNIIMEYNDARIHVTKNEKNIGEYQNRNKLLASARGNYILFVDGDDILYRHTLRNLSEYVHAFPEAGMVWGLNHQYFPFFVFPYLVTPEVNMKLIYSTGIPIANIGFGEILFKTSELKKIGISSLYKTGDTFLKKKLALTVPVLYVNIGFMFWRQSPHQASKTVTRGMNAFLERAKMDMAIVNDPDFPCEPDDRTILKKNVRISILKLFFKSTLLKGNISDFFKHRKELNISLKDLNMLFAKGFYNYSPTRNLEEPLFNSYNFERF